MPRRRKPAGLECLAELARKTAILERELCVQREAIERLMETARVPERSERRGGGARPVPSVHPAHVTPAPTGGLR